MKDAIEQARREAEKVAMIEHLKDVEALADMYPKDSWLWALFNYALHAHADHVTISMKDGNLEFRFNGDFFSIEETLNILYAQNEFDWNGAGLRTLRSHTHWLNFEIPMLVESDLFMARFALDLSDTSAVSFTQNHDRVMEALDAACRGPKYNIAQSVEFKLTMNDIDPTYIGSVIRENQANMSYMIAFSDTPFTIELEEAGEVRCMLGNHGAPKDITMTIQEHDMDNYGTITVCTVNSVKVARMTEGVSRLFCKTPLPSSYALDLPYIVCNTDLYLDAERHRIEISPSCRNKFLLNVKQAANNLTDHALCKVGTTVVFEKEGDCHE